MVTTFSSGCQDSLPIDHHYRSRYHSAKPGRQRSMKVAFNLADAIAYVQSRSRRGFTSTTFAPQLSFFFNAHSDLLEENRQVSAAPRFGRASSRGFQARESAVTGGCGFHHTRKRPGSSLTLSSRKHIVRVAIQALAAVLGGCQSLPPISLDEACPCPPKCPR